MTLAKCNLALALLSLALLSACGSPGEPVPPSLELARPVNDLRAARKGNTVKLTWSQPTRTTDGRNIHRTGPTGICRAAEAMKQCGVPVAKLAQPKTHDTAKSPAGGQTYTDTLSSPSSDAASKVVYAVEVLNTYGRSAGLSNQVEVPAAPTLPAPSDLRVQLSGEGARLTWAPLSEAPQTAGLRFICRIYRREGANPQLVAGEVPVDAATTPTFLDGSIEWEKTYAYHATVVTLITEPKAAEQQVEGDDTPEVTMVAHDVFPPAVPEGIQAVFSGPGQKPFVDLVWTPDTDADLAGYNVYRAEPGAALEPKKLNTDPVKSPAFRDEGVRPGHKYTYFVAAVDSRGNESGRSDRAEEKVPEQ